MTLPDLYFIDKHARKVVPVPYNRELEKDTVRYKHTRREALGVLAEYLHELMTEVSARYHEVKRELAHADHVQQTMSKLEVSIEKATSSWEGVDVDEFCREVRGD